MSKRKYDFAGWVTKNDIVCSDGVVIKHDAFKENDGKQVPLVWNHNYDNPSNVLGHVVLENHKSGVYGYGYLNGTAESENARQMLRHGDISAMSIGARKLKKAGSNITHGLIYEVSLVLAAANPGALIEHVTDTITHSSDGKEVKDSDYIIHTGTILHSAEALPDEPEEDEEKVDDLQHADTATVEPKTIGSILDTMNEEQREAVTALIGSIIDEDEENDNTGDDDSMKQNVFSGADNKPEEVLKHADFATILSDARKAGTLKEAIIQHGITNIELLFPDAHLLDKEPAIFRDENTGAAAIVDGTTKSPFARIKTRYADFTADEARAKGYIKGNEKVEQVFPIAQRETLPQTVYKKQKLDRDDIIDITDFDVVRYINKEMRFMLIEELGRAILVGDGRNVVDPDKIKEDKIRPIINDHDLYTLKKEYTDAKDLVESVILGMIDYKGSGAPVAYIDPLLLAQVKLLKGTDGRYLAGHILSDSEVATQFGVSRVVPTTLMQGKGVLVVNLRDYTVGSTKGGEITTFDDFDIDFNQYKYLIETRLSGALTQLHSAIHFAPADGE